MKRIVLLLFVLAVVGCNKAETKSAAQNTEAEAVHHSHEVDGWCTEHGVPEKICSLCNSKVAAECKKNGDWCKEHDRAESQCFICHPEYAEKFIAQYEAQYGKKPPKAE